MKEKGTKGQVKTDPELLAEARRNPDAFHEFYERYSLTLGSWLQKRTGSVDVAVDLVAETFAQAWFGLRRFKGSEDDSGACWIFGIAKNLLGTYFRRKKVEAAGRRKLGMMVSETGAEAFERAEEALDARSQAPELAEAVGVLPPEQWAALQLRVIGDLSYSEVASRLGCSENAARLRVSRALSTLRAELEGEQA